MQSVTTGAETSRGKGGDVHQDGGRDGGEEEMDIGMVVLTKGEGEEAKQRKDSDSTLSVAT